MNDVKLSNVRRVYVEKKPAFAVKAKELQAEIKNYLGIDSVTGVRELIRTILKISQRRLIKKHWLPYFQSLRWTIFMKKHLN